MWKNSAVLYGVVKYQRYWKHCIEIHPKRVRNALWISGEHLSESEEQTFRPWGRCVLGLSNNGVTTEFEQNKEAGEWEMMQRQLGTVS